MKTMTDRREIEMEAREETTEIETRDSEIGMTTTTTTTEKETVTTIETEKETEMIAMIIETVTKTDTIETDAMTQTRKDEEIEVIAITAKIGRIEMIVKAIIKAENLTSIHHHTILKQAEGPNKKKSE